jgi:hypothetical protein
MPNRLIPPICLAILLAGCATPEEPASQAVAQSGTAAVRECRYSEGTGSNMRRRVCATQAEWAAYDAAEKEQDSEEFFRRAREGGTTAGNVDQPDIGGF